jgi:Rhs element Vgr protein
LTVPVSPQPEFGATITAKLFVDGKAVPTNHPLVALDVWLAVNKVSHARVTIADGSPADENFPISASSTYVPGAKLQIELGYDDDTKKIFSGLIITHGLDVSPDAAACLVIEAVDPALVLTLARRTAVFTDQTDSQVIKKLIEDQKLTAAVTATSEVHPCLVQYASSDWDLMVMRAELNGMLVTTGDGTVTVAPPDTSADASLSLVYGNSIRQAQLKLDASTQLAPAALKTLAWDPATQQLSQGGLASVDVEELGNLSSEQLAKVFAVASAPQQTAATLPPADLTGWSKAELMRMRLAKVRGQLSCAGTAVAVPTAMVALKGLGERFDGKALISAVQHQVRAGEWSTQLDIGLDPEPFAARATQISPPPAAGLLPAISQLQVGLVLKQEQDPQGEFRLLIQLPLVQAPEAKLWARLASPYATAKAGLQFWPEVGDEVLVAFMDGDPRFPVVLGCVYSKQKTPPQPLDEKNNLKSIVTRSLLRIDFDDDKKTLEISTPDKRKVRLDDEAKKILISDADGNSISLASDGIILSSNADLQLTAKGAISLDAKQGLDLKGTSKASLAAANVEISADSTLLAKGAAEAKLSSAASVVIQAALVKIN